MTQESDNMLDALLAPVKTMDTVDQLAFWRRFRAVHRGRIAKTEAELCPELLAAVDDHIVKLTQLVASGA
jgi:hypothetical protein